MVSSMIDPEVLASVRELQSEEDPSFLKRYLTVFLDAIPPRLQAILEMIREANSAGLASEAHALRSSCANTGVKSMTEICAKLESLGNAGSTQGAVGFYQQLLVEHEKLQAEVRSLPEFTR